MSIAFLFLVPAGLDALTVFPPKSHDGSKKAACDFGGFTLEPRPGGTLLTLESQHRVSTRFNGYATVWSRAIMADLQERICGVIRSRSEKRHG